MAAEVKSRQEQRVNCSNLASLMSPGSPLGPLGTTRAVIPTVADRALRSPIPGTPRGPMARLRRAA